MPSAQRSSCRWHILLSSFSSGDAYYTKIICFRPRQFAWRKRDFVQPHFGSPGVSRFFACARACQRGRALLSLFWRGSCASNRRAESVLPRLRHADPAADAGSSRRTRRLRAVPALSSLRMLATAQSSLPCGPRIGLASGLRGDPRPPPQGQRRERKRCPFLRRFGYNTRCQENKQKKGQHCE